MFEGVFSKSNHIHHLASLKTFKWGQVPWLTSVILATLEVEIERIAVQGCPGQKVNKASS
jgi:hypothetical protein